MSDFPKVFVGTLYSGEAEYDLACEAISSQRNVLVKHQVITGLSEIQAHNALWSSWESVKLDFDYFIKVDADTILVDDLAISRIVDVFRSNQRVTGIQIFLKDYFTDSLIAGLNCFTPKVIFKQATNRLMPDRVDSNHDIVLTPAEVDFLAPIGWHCLNPHDKQAFHYGLHRKLKKQNEVLQLLAKKWLSDGGQDDARGWALSGAMSASFWTKKCDYQDSSFKKIFEKKKRSLSRLPRVHEFAYQLVKS